MRLEQRGDRPLLTRDHARAVGVGAHDAQTHPAREQVGAGPAAPTRPHQRAPRVLVQWLDEQ